VSANLIVMPRAMSMSFTTFSKIGLLVITALVTQSFMTSDTVVRGPWRLRPGEGEEALSRVSFPAGQAQAVQVNKVQAQKDALHSGQGSGTEAVLLVRPEANRTGPGAFRRLNGMHENSHEARRLEQEASASTVEIKAA